MKKILALYLPQFHVTPENNKWWGEGFTEWTNTKKAQKLFSNHYQPRIPLHKNYYNLLDPQILKSQAALAKEYGIFGFCFYHYWFNGVKMLYKPLELLLDTPSIEIPFCLSWANDSWNKGWDGSDKEILIQQDYGDEETWKQHIEYLLPFFKDSRYIKQDNKPVFLIYRAMGFSQMDKMIAYWEKILINEGFAGIFIVETLNSFQQQPFCQRSNAVFTFEPMLTLRTNISIINKIKGKLKNWFNINPFLTDDYSRVWKKLLKNINKKKYGEKKIFRGAFVDWDNTPRKGRRGLAMKNATPEKFGLYLKKLLALTASEPGDFIIINAWNEWAEGCYLEPDEKYEYKYLEQVKSLS